MNMIELRTPTGRRQTSWLFTLDLYIEVVGGLIKGEEGEEEVGHHFDSHQLPNRIRIMSRKAFYHLRIQSSTLLNLKQTDRYFIMFNNDQVVLKILIKTELNLNLYFITCVQGNFHSP